MLAGAVARLAGVTVRALHHYDEVELRRMSDAVALAMEAHQLDIPLAPEERLEVFGPFDPDEHAAEAHERWGDADAYRESARSRPASRSTCKTRSWPTRRVTRADPP